MAAYNNNNRAYCCAVSELARRNTPLFEHHNSHEEHEISGKECCRDSLLLPAASCRDTAERLSGWANTYLGSSLAPTNFRWPQLCCWRHTISGQESSQFAFASLSVWPTQVFRFQIRNRILFHRACRWETVFGSFSFSISISISFSFTGYRLSRFVGGQDKQLRYLYCFVLFHQTKLDQTRPIFRLSCSTKEREGGLF